MFKAEKLCVDSGSNSVIINPRNESQNRSLSPNNDGSVIADNIIKIEQYCETEATSVKKSSELDTSITTTSTATGLLNTLLI